MKSLNKKVSLVTGALSGIGRETAIALAKAGADVVVSGRKEEAGQKLAAEIHALGVRSLFVKADVRNEADVAALVTTTVEKMGRLDIAVNNAGVEGELGPIVGQTAENYANIFDTNVKGVVFALKHEVAAMLPHKAGAIVNLSSVLGHNGMGGASIYAASKHAVEGLTKSVALELAAEGIRVNGVAPGPVQTPMFDRFTGNDANAKAGLAGMVPTKRVSTAQEIADSIVFLVSPAASSITGTILSVDGGWSAQ
jgi:NAD(P)-dependent dehydrogenase (short-subunit alcohol dehydrogenase family)